MITTYQRRKFRNRKAIKSNNKGNRVRIVVHKSNKNTYAQVIDDKGNVLFQESSLNISDKKSGIEKSNIIGERLAQKFKEHKIDCAVYDKGAFNFIGRVVALAQSIVKNGIKI